MGEFISLFFTDAEFFLMAMAIVLCSIVAYRALIRPVRKKLKGDGSETKMNRKGGTADDQEMIQDLWARLEKMDERMSNIETILLSKVKPKPSIEEEFENLKHEGETAQ